MWRSLTPGLRPEDLAILDLETTGLLTLAGKGQREVDIVQYALQYGDGSSLTQYTNVLEDAVEAYVRGDIDAANFMTYAISNGRWTNSSRYLGDVSGDVFARALQATVQARLEGRKLPSAAEALKEVQKLLESGKTIAGWNVEFDINALLQTADRLDQGAADALGTSGSTGFRAALTKAIGTGQLEKGVSGRIIDASSNMRRFIYQKGFQEKALPLISRDPKYWGPSTDQLNNILDNFDAGSKHLRGLVQKHAGFSSLMEQIETKGLDMYELDPSRFRRGERIIRNTSELDWDTFFKYFEDEGRQYTQAWSMGFTKPKMRYVLGWGQETITNALGGDKEVIKQMYGGMRAHVVGQLHDAGIDVGVTKFVGDIFDKLYDPDIADESARKRAFATELAKLGPYHKYDPINQYDDIIADFTHNLGSEMVRTATKRQVSNYVEKYGNAVMAGRQQAVIYNSLKALDPVRRSFAKGVKPGMVSVATTAGGIQERVVTGGIQTVAKGFHNMFKQHTGKFLLGGAALAWFTLDALISNQAETKTPYPDPTYPDSWDSIRNPYSSWNTVQSLHPSNMAGANVSDFGSGFDWFRALTRRAFDSISGLKTKAFNNPMITELTLANTLEDISSQVSKSNVVHKLEQEALAHGPTAPLLAKMRTEHNWYWAEREAETAYRNMVRAPRIADTTVFPEVASKPKGKAWDFINTKPLKLTMPPGPVYYDSMKPVLRNELYTAKGAAPYVADMRAMKGKTRPPQPIILMPSKGISKPARAGVYIERDTQLKLRSHLNYWRMSRTSLSNVTWTDEALETGPRFMPYRRGPHKTYNEMIFLPEHPDLPGMTSYSNLFWEEFVTKAKGMGFEITPELISSIHPEVGPSQLLKGRFFNKFAGLGPEVLGAEKEAKLFYKNIRQWLKQNMRKRGYTEYTIQKTMKSLGLNLNVRNISKTEGEIIRKQSSPYYSMLKDIKAGRINFDTMVRESSRGIEEVRSYLRKYGEAGMEALFLNPEGFVSPIVIESMESMGIRYNPQLMTHKKTKLEFMARAGDAIAAYGARLKSGSGIKRISGRGLELFGKDIRGWGKGALGLAGVFALSQAASYDNPALGMAVEGPLAYGLYKLSQIGYGLSAATGGLSGLAALAVDFIIYPLISDFLRSILNEGAPPQVSLPRDTAADYLHGHILGIKTPESAGFHGLNPSGQNQSDFGSGYDREKAGFSLDLDPGVPEPTKLRKGIRDRFSPVAGCVQALHENAIGHSRRSAYGSAQRYMPVIITGSEMRS